MRCQNLSFLIKERFYRLITRVNQPYSGLVHRSVTIHWKAAIYGKPSVRKIHNRSTSGSRNSYVLVPGKNCDDCHQTIKKQKEIFTKKGHLAIFSQILHSLLKLDIFLERSFQNPISITTDQFSFWFQRNLDRIKSFHAVQIACCLMVRLWHVPSSFWFYLFFILEFLPCGELYDLPIESFWNSSLAGKFV